jgi:hypothetical protein
VRKVNINRLLTRAEEQFSLGKYESALTTYGLLLREHPSHGDAKIGAFLCDIGMESSQEAQALYDYYQIIKREQDNAGEVMTNLISTLDSTKDKIGQLLSPIEERVDYQDGIGYKDFLEFVETRGDFGRAFEDVMFSTKVILKGKDEYINFITELINKGQNELAEQFLDSMSSAFGKNQDIYELYHRLDENKNK